MKRAIYPLYAPADEGKVKPILAALREKGAVIQSPEAKCGKADALLLFLSKNVGAEGPEADAFFRLSAGREQVIPVDLDGSTPPEALQNALMARHTLDGTKYGPEELAERIARAVKDERKSRLPLILSAAAAVILLAAVAVILLMPRYEGPPPDPDLVSPPAEAGPLPTPRMPLTDVDLASIVEVVYVGDHLRYYALDAAAKEPPEMQGWFSFAYSAWSDGDYRFYSKEDGHEYSRQAVDLQWLVYLPNLRYLSLCGVSGALPDLSGLSRLEEVLLFYSDIPDLEGLRNSESLLSLSYHGTSVKDFSSLSDCPRLNDVWLNLLTTEEADFSRFCPPGLQVLSFGNGNSLSRLDLSALRNCPELRELELDYLPLTDLSFLSGAEKLSSLRLSGMRSLRDLSGLEGTGRLQELEVNNCPSLQDVSALAGCTDLRNVRFDGESMHELKDVSVLGSLPRLNNIHLFAANPQDLDFLRALPTRTHLCFSCNLGAFDCSGLEAIESFENLSLTCWDLPYAAVAPYLAGKTVENLDLYGAADLDLSALPRVGRTLSLTDCGIRDLTGIGSTAVARLGLYNCQYMTSLEGIGELSAHGGRLTALTVEGCPRLTDWSALQGKRLQELTLRNVWSLPDLSEFTVVTLQLESIAADVLPDLSLLEGLDTEQSFSLRMADVDQISGLQPLFRLRGDMLEVPPQLEDQAAELVANGLFHRYEIVYPDGSWQPDDTDIRLLSLEELDALPKSILKRVRSLTLVGDVLVNDETTEVREDHDESGPFVRLRNRATGEETVVREIGTWLTDFSRLTALTGLETLSLWYQPLIDLDGIQALEGLKALEVKYSPAFTDASAAFTVQTLERICFSRTGLASIQGVQNLLELRELYIGGTNVIDMSCLLGLEHLGYVEVSGDMIAAVASLDEGYGFELNVLPR